MHEHEENDQRRGDEMDGARRLASAEEVEQPGERGVDRPATWSGPARMSSGTRTKMTPK